MQPACFEKALTLKIHSILANQYLLFQTMSSIAAEKNSTIIFPVPIDFLTQFSKNQQSPTKKNK